MLAAPTRAAGEAAGSSAKVSSMLAATAAHAGSCHCTEARASAWTRARSVRAAHSASSWRSNLRRFISDWGRRRRTGGAETP